MEALERENTKSLILVGRKRVKAVNKKFMLLQNYSTVIRITPIISKVLNDIALDRKKY